MTTLSITSTYSEENDAIYVRVLSEDRFLSAFLLNAEDQSIKTVVKLDPLDDEDYMIDHLPIMNAFHLIAIALKALVDATTEDTEIPMCLDNLDAPITVEI